MTIRKVTICLSLMLIFAGMAVAQEYPKTEVYFGYNFVRVAPPERVNAFNSNGGVGALQYNLGKNLGIVAEFGGNTNGNISIGGILTPCTGTSCSGTYSSANFPGDQTQFSYLFGPRLFINKAKKLSPFFTFLVGGMHNSRSFSVPNSRIPAGFVKPSGLTVETGTNYTKFRSTQNAYAMSIGGGFDIALSHGLALRPMQVDYMPSHFSPFNVVLSGTGVTVKNDTRWQHNLRYSAGITLRFGGQ